MLLMFAMWCGVIRGRRWREGRDMQRVVEHDVQRDAIALLPECKVGATVDECFKMLHSYTCVLIDTGQNSSTAARQFMFGASALEAAHCRCASRRISHPAPACALHLPAQFLPRVERRKWMPLGVWGLGFGVWGLGFGVRVYGVFHIRRWSTRAAAAAVAAANKQLN